LQRRGADQDARNTLATFMVIPWAVNARQVAQTGKGLAKKNIQKEAV